MRVDDDDAVELDAPDVGALLADAGLAPRGRAPTGRRHDRATADLRARWSRARGRSSASGLNYRTHILEMGRELPAAPDAVRQVPRGAGRAVRRPDRARPASDAVDWEAELAVVIGRRACGGPTRRPRGGDRRVHRAQRRHRAGLAVPHLAVAAGQDLRGHHPDRAAGWSPRTSCPAGSGPRLDCGCAVDGETVADGRTPPTSSSTPSTWSPTSRRIVTLNPGDVIATGTPGGVGHARKPPEYLREGSTVSVEFEGLGRQANAVHGSGVTP